MLYFIRYAFSCVFMILYYIKIVRFLAITSLLQFDGGFVGLYK